MIIHLGTLALMVIVNFFIHQLSLELFLNTSKRSHQLQQNTLMCPMRGQGR